MRLRTKQTDFPSWYLSKVFLGENGDEAESLHILHTLPGHNCNFKDRWAIIVLLLVSSKDIMIIILPWPGDNFKDRWTLLCWSSNPTAISGNGTLYQWQCLPMLAMFATSPPERRTSLEASISTAYLSTLLSAKLWARLVRGFAQMSCCLMKCFSKVPCEKLQKAALRGFIPLRVE